MTNAFAVHIDSHKLKLPINFGLDSCNRGGGFHRRVNDEESSSPVYMHSQTRVSMCNSEDVPPLETEPPRRVLLIVEPTPFTYVSGYANRFQEMLKYMKKAGDQVHIITPCADSDAPTEFMGFPITNLKGFNFFLYPDVRIAYDYIKETHNVIRDFKPDLWFS